MLFPFPMPYYITPVPAMLNLIFFSILKRQPRWFGCGASLKRLKKNLYKKHLAEILVKMFLRYAIVFISLKQICILNSNILENNYVIKKLTTVDLKLLY